MFIGISSIHNSYPTVQRQNSSVIQDQVFVETLVEKSTDSLISDLENKFGTKIYVESIGKSQKDAERLAFRSAGNGNIVIAPNILEEMATDPEVRQNIEQKVQEYFNSIPSNEQYLASRGFNMVASGVTVHEDGTVSQWIFQDQTPEEKARIRRLQEEEDKEKLKKIEEQRVIIERLNDDKKADERLILKKQYFTFNSVKSLTNEIEYSVIPQTNKGIIREYESNFAYNY